MRSHNSCFGSKISFHKNIHLNGGRENRTVYNHVQHWLHVVGQQQETVFNFVMQKCKIIHNELGMCFFVVVLFLNKIEIIDTIALSYSCRTT